MTLLLVGCSETEVEITRPRRGAIRESFREPARTRLTKTYLMAMPIGGRVGRIDLEPGDSVRIGQTLVVFDRQPLERARDEATATVGELKARTAVLDDDAIEQTQLATAQAEIHAAGEALKAAEARVAAARARLGHARKELERTKKLAVEQAVPESRLDDAQLAAETAEKELRAAQAARGELQARLQAAALRPESIRKALAQKKLKRKVLVQQLVRAETALAHAEYELGLAQVRSPIDGVVLERFEQGDTSLPAGRRLLLLGDLDQLEAVAEVLSQDVLRLAPGAAVTLELGPGREPLAGTVKRIEPAGFTKLSSLGVEQQRVNVIVDLQYRPTGLGVGYRLQAEFLTATKAGALVVPRFSVLQDPDGSFYVFKVQRGALVRQPVRLGLQNDLELEILEGLAETDTIVSAPDAGMQAGDKVRVPNTGAK